MAKSTFWGKAKKKIKEWFSGGNNKSTPPKPRAVATNRDARNQTVSSRTSAPSFNKRAFVSSLNDSKKDKKEENRVQDAFKASKYTYKSMVASPTDSLKKLDSALKKDVPDPKQAAAQKSKERAKKTAKKAGNALYFMATDEERKAIDAVKDWNKANKQQYKEFHERTGNKYNAHTGDKAHDKQAAQLIKGGFDSADPVAEELAIKYHPTALSATRGALSGTTFGLSELAIQSQAKRDKERAKNEQYYQENKNRGAELAGELVGSLAGFGGVSKVAEVPAAKIVGTELGEKAVGKLAASRLTRATSKRALKKLGVEASEDLIKNVARRKAEKVATGLATGTLVDATAGNLMNATMASRDYERGSKEWWKAFGKYAKWNALMGAGVSLAPALVGGKGIAAEEATKLFNQQRRQAVEEGADAVKNYLWAERGVGAGNVPNRGRLFGESLDERIARQDARTNFTREMRGNKGSLVDRANALDEELAGNPIQDGINIRDLAKQKPAEAVEAVARQNADEVAETAAKSVEESKAIGAIEDDAKSAAESFGKRRKKVNARLMEENPQIAEIYDADKSGRWVFYRDKTGELCVGNPRAEHGTISVDGVNQSNGGYFGKLTQENFERAKRAFDEDNIDPFLSKAKGAKEEAENLKLREDAMDKKVQNILDYIGEGEEPAPSGVKPAAETLEPREIPSLRERDYTIEKTFQSGTRRKVTVRATSDAEALDKVYAEKNAKNIKNAKILDSVEATPASEAAAKGTKPAAATLEPKGTKAAPKTDTGFAPKSVDEITANSGVKHEKVSNKEKVHDFWGSFRTKFVDSLDAFEQANKEFLKSDPERWALNNGAIDKLRRHQGMAVRSISEGQLGWNGQRLKGVDGEAAKSLKAIYEGLDAEREKLFETYLLLEHSPYRTAAGKPIYAGEFAEREACEKAAKEILKDNPDFERRANELYQYTRNELQNRVDAGLIPQEVADDWFKKYPKYVPTGRQGEFRPDEDIWEVAHELARNGNTVKPSEIKAAQEAVSDSPIRSIKEQLSEATTRNWRDMSMNNLFKRMFGDKAAAQLAVEADGGLVTVLDNTVNLSKTAGKAGKGGKYYAEVFVDGKPQRVEIEKRFYDAIKDLNKNGRVGDAIDFASDVASKLSTPFKNVVTSWNPIFMVKNGMRDFPEAVINSRNTKEFMECMDAALKDLYGVEGGGMWTTALRNQGVSQANFVNLEEALTKERTLLGKGANKFATLQEAVETYPRLVEFMATIKKLNGGVLPETLDNIPMEWLDIAAANAADVTVNFGRSGSIGKMLNRGFVPFFNPSVQGFDKFIRNLSQQPSTAKLLGTITKALALGTGVTAVNNMLLSDNPYYQQIAAREKATNILIACPFKIEDGKVTMVDKDEANVFIKIPKSRFAAAYSIPMVNVANENKMGWAEMFKVAGDQVAPVNPVESNILAPYFLAKKNTTWYGTPIVSQSIENKTNPSQEYDANTSLIGKALGKATSKLPKEFQISPKKADYVLDSTTGVFGDFLLPMMTPSRQGGGKNPLAKGGYAAGNVVKRAFSIDANTQNDLSTRFYDSIQVAEDNKKLANSSAEDKDEYNRLSAYSKEVSGLNQAIRHLQDGERGTKQEDIYELQKVRNQLMKDALDGKPVPTSEKMLDAVHEYVGTTYAVESFGSSADKEAMKVYGEAVYGNLSKKEMQARIDSDKNFYKGVRAIGGLEDKLDKEGVKSTNVLSKAVALASIDADDDLFGAYKCTKQSRTETADKMTRARDYISNGGSDEEFVQLEKARRTMGKLSDYDKDAELDKIDEQLKNGEISYEEYYNKQGEIKYNANISRVGLATSLAMANAPERAYRLYDIKDANIQKGINLAAMGYDARGYREMAKAIDTSGNGYLSRQEVVDYVANSGVADKATLFDALYPYQTKYNPFGTPTKYSISQAAETGRAKGFASIGGANNDFKISDSGKGNGNSYGGYGGYRHYKHYGGGYGGGSTKVPALKQSAFKASKQTYKDIASVLKTTRKSNSTRVANTVKVEPPTVKFKKYEV